MKKRTLSKKTILGCLIFAVVLTIAICLAVGIWYQRDQMEEYRVLAYSYTGTAADYIDGDKVLSYLQTKEKDAYYEQVMYFFDTTMQQTNMEYYYVFVPYADELVYIWDAKTVYGSSALGEREEYTMDGKEAVEKIFRQDPPEEIIVARTEKYGYTATAYSPIFNSAGEPVAVVGVDLSMSEIQRDLLHFTFIIILCVASVTTLSVMLFLAFIQGKIVRPIALLNQTARHMVENLEKESIAEAEIHTGDEIEELSESFIGMHKEVRSYIQRLASVTAEKERIGAELNIAAQIQSDMLPQTFPAFPDRTDFDIYATMDPAKEVGGDFYDFFLVDDDHLALVIADVSGKGVPAALFMMVAKLLIKNAVQARLSPKAILERVNDQLCENNQAEMFVTAWLGILEISTGHMVCANAGHEYPAVCRKGGGFELFKDSHGFVLAGMPGVRYKEYALTLHEGDTLFVYTDGVPESTSGEEVLYGTERMLAALNRDGSCDSRTLLENVRADIDAFVKDAPQFDDITMLSIKILKTQMNKLSVKPELSSVEPVTQFYERILRNNHVPEKVIAQVNIVVDELYSNITRYSGATNATLGYCITDDTLHIRFSDNGTPYDPTKKPDPNISAPAEEREIGGLGVYMAKQIMDSMVYTRQNGMNILTLEKSLKA